MPGPFYILCRRGDSRIARHVRCPPRPNQKDQPKLPRHCEARRAVAIRVPCGAKHRPSTHQQPPAQTRRTSPKLPRHCEARRAVAIRIPAVRSTARPPPQGDGKRTDCHVASLLAMTEVDDGWSCCFFCGGHRWGGGRFLNRPYNLTMKKQPCPVARTGLSLLDQVTQPSALCTYLT